MKSPESLRAPQEVQANPWNNADLISPARKFRPRADIRINLGLIRFSAQTFSG
jgi:hypothetical protein